MPMAKVDQIYAKEKKNQREKEKKRREDIERQSMKWEEKGGFPTKPPPSNIKFVGWRGYHKCPSANPKKVGLFFHSSRKCVKKKTLLLLLPSEEGGVALVILIYMGLFLVFVTVRLLVRENWGRTSSISLLLSLFYLISPLSPLLPFSLSQSIFSLFCVYSYHFIAVIAFFYPLLFLGFFFLLLLFFGREKMMKKKTRVSVDPAPSTSFLVGEEARARFKHQCLLQDYQELLKETEGKKERLNNAMQRKLKLLAEVKFLSKKYQSLSNIPRVLMKPFGVKKQSCKDIIHHSHPVIETKPPLKERNLKSKESFVQSSTKLTDLNHFKVPLKERNHKAREAAVQSTPKLLDLNQASLPNGEEMELEVKWEPLKIDKLKRSLFEGDAMVDDNKFSVCRDIGSSQSGWETGNFHGKISSL